MNKFLLILYIFAASIVVSAQNTTGKKSENEIALINAAKNASEYETLFAKFSKSTSIERWQAHYYSAVVQYLKTESLIKKSTPQSLFESNALALKYAGSIIDSQPDNADVKILVGLARLQRIQLNNSPDVQKDKELIIKIISEAEALSPDNPRLTVLKAGMAAKFSDLNLNSAQLYAKAAKDFETETAPNWGKQLLSLTK
ncbi:hypothetical protein [Chryseobacterium caseinilyticum]|uniref:Tetratricopeptide repeat protein n=1 Tax=Chryseobacterium caseinilyticum TaxID=2771428 RepID=A0ABR8ZGB1_9FLAO|nr:hypothetical protein [Chryseobacterium caseinilyticum]MBD8084348.1 hypothetical protein [Chryseobacterium caseinilyticum]